MRNKSYSDNKFIDKINSNTLEWENAGYTKDDACDAYIVYAEWLNGTPLNDDELQEFMDDYNAICYYHSTLLDAQVNNMEALGDFYKDMKDGN